MNEALVPSTVPSAATTITAGPPLCAATEPLPRSEILQTWPRSAQWATAFLLGVAAAFVAVYSLGHLRSGSRPMELERGALLTYRVDLNHARRAELLQLPGIGPSMADRIEDYRQTRGGFHTVEDLTRIKGFGPAILEPRSPSPRRGAPPRARSTG
jgi:competence protein ComEA